MSKKHRRTHLVLLWTICIIFLLITNPTKLPVIMLIIPFGLLAAAVYASCKAILIKYSRDTGNRIRNLSIAGTSIIIIGLALQSLGQLTVRDVIVAGLAVAVGYFYINRTSQT